MKRSFQATRGIEGGLAIRWAVTLLLAVTICAGPLWLWGVPLRWYYLKMDDFVYLARSRSASALWAHLVKPHNGHVVPLFLLETHLLTRLAGSLEALPQALCGASYATLVLAMTATGHLVARETGRPAQGLTAMAAVGFTSVLGPALLWYSAGQALAAGTMVVAMLAALQAWRRFGRWWLLALGLVATVAAPLLWTAGYAAGLVGMAYLWADGRRACRIAAALPPAVSVVTGLWVRGIAGRAIATTSQHAAGPFPSSGNLVPAILHSTQAVCEALVVNNLGLEAATTAPQALVLGALLAGLWIWSRPRINSGRWLRMSRMNPLEAAGAVLVAASFGLVFSVRGVETTFDNLRALGWYDAIPELGAVLFVFGWWSGRLESPPPKSLSSPQLRELLAVAIIAAVMLALHGPRAERVIYRYDGAAAPLRMDAPLVVPNRTAAELALQARNQRRALAALDRLERTAREQGASRPALRRALVGTTVPGMPDFLTELSVLELLDIPSAGSDSD
jgi:hypothetical protein